MKKAWEMFETGLSNIYATEFANSMQLSLGSEGRQHIPNGVIFSPLNPFIKRLSVMQRAHSS